MYVGTTERVYSIISVLYTACPKKKKPYNNYNIYFTPTDSNSKCQL